MRKQSQTACNIEEGQPVLYQQTAIQHLLAEKAASALSADSQA